MKKIILIVVPILLIVGGVVGAALMGKINIPGLTPKKKGAVNLYGANKLYGEEKDKVPVAAKKKEEPKPVPKPKLAETDPAKGAKRLAKLWNDLEPAKVNEISAKWNVDDLVPVLMVMDGEKVAALVALMDPKRADAVSRKVKELASVVPSEKS